MGSTLMLQHSSRRWTISEVVSEVIEAWRRSYNVPVGRLSWENSLVSSPGAFPTRVLPGEEGGEVTGVVAFVSKPSTLTKDADFGILAVCLS